MKIEKLVSAEVNKLGLDLRAVVDGKEAQIVISRGLLNRLVSSMEPVEMELS